MYKKIGNISVTKFICIMKRSISHVARLIYVQPRFYKQLNCPHVASYYCDM